jgi:hydroxypyruvate reductase
MSVTFEHPNLHLPRRQRILEVLQAALVGADPYRAVRNAVTYRRESLAVGDQSIDLEGVDNVYVVGAGKAAGPMAQAIEDIFEGNISDGVVAVKDGYGASTSRVAVGEAAHPVPDERSIKAARAITHVADVAGEDDLVLCLISGGGSSLLELPAGSLSLEHLRRTTAALMASGVTIDEMNTVRKHLSSIKGGQLAEIIAPARHVTIAVSDVVGNREDVIASGLTVPDPTSFQDALDIVERPTIVDRIPDAVLGHLRAGRDGTFDETPTADHPAFDGAVTRIVADRTDAADAASKAAVGAGYNPRVMTTDMEGEARDVGREIAREVLGILDDGEPVPAPACLVYAGETTVTVRGRGKGGRNQELALSAAVALEEAAMNIDRPVAVGAFATDGTDGPTTAAGAIVGPETVQRGRKAGRDARLELRNNNSFEFLEAADDLLFTGPTRNNVNDIICVLVG